MVRNFLCFDSKVIISKKIILNFPRKNNRIHDKMSYNKLSQTKRSTLLHKNKEIMYGYIDLVRGRVGIKYG